MTQADPQARPTSKEAKLWLEKEILAQRPINLRWRLQPRKEWLIKKGWRELACGIREVNRVLKRHIGTL